MLTPTIRRDAQPWSPAGAATDPLLKISWSRATAALRRSKWLMALVLLLGVSIGIAATRLSTPVFEAQARLWIANDRGGQNADGAAPIRAANIMRQTAWPELLTSFAVLDTVVRKTTLNIIPAKATDTALFANFQSRSEEHTSELQSPCNLVCRLLLEK